MEKLSNFEEEYNKEKPEISFERGIVEVSLSEIRGSVGRYRDFENSNLLKNKEWSERTETLEKQLEKNSEISPLDLYKLKNNYFILDGHHRFLIAQQMGLKTVKARVIEYLPPKNSPENILQWERSRFERMTTLTDISLTELSQYDKLLDQIREHKYYRSEELKEEQSFIKSAKDWYESIFLPIMEKIDENKLIEKFPGRTKADLYTYVSDYKWHESKKRGYDIGFSAAISELHKKESHTFIEMIMLKLPLRKTPLMMEFREKTGIESIVLSKDFSYGLLIKQIEEHRYFMSLKHSSEVSLREAGNDWYYDVYRPVTDLLAKESHSVLFSSKTLGDLYLQISEEKWLESEKQGYDVGFTQAVKSLMEKKTPSALLKNMLKSMIINMRGILHENS